MGKVSKATKISKSFVKKGISKSETTTAYTKPSLDDLTNIIENEPVSRGKRKRAVKRARLESRKAFVEAALNSRKHNVAVSGFGPALGDFNDLEEAIEESPLTTPLTPVITERHKKSKWTKGALKRDQKVKSDQLDVERFQTLMGIPDFASDPLAAMEKHLLNAKKKREQRENASVHRKTEMEVSL